MRVLLTGGGTGGHINPAIAIAQYIKEQDKNAKILYAGTPNGMEARLVKQADFDFEPIEVRGFSRSFMPKDIARNCNALYLAITSKKRAREIIKSFKPDIVIGTGGYVSGPVVLQATKLGIKTVIHEQNAYPGITNRLLAKKVDKIFLAVAEAKKRMGDGLNYEVVGNPVRAGIIGMDKEMARKQLNLNDDFCILSYGGSLGSVAINRMVADLIEWHHDMGGINHIHSYGTNGKDSFPQNLTERNIDLSKKTNIRVSEYIDNMDVCMAAADLLICRAGAITISEAEATGKPVIFVPSPNVTENHQYHNAMVLVNRGAGLILEEKDYTKEKLIKMVKELFEDRGKLQRIAKNARSLAITDTTKRIYETIVRML